MRIIILILVLIYSNIGISQTVDLKTNSEIHDDYLNIKYTITNKTNGSIILYKPSEEDFCNGILSISFKNSKGEDISYNNCEELQHLDAITLNCFNLRILGVQESLTFYFKVDKPSFLEESFFVKFVINYSDIYFLNDKINCDIPVFKETLMTNYEKI